MPAPSYARSKNFQADGGDRTDHGAINAELDKVAQAINSLAGLIGLILKDDNTLEAGVDLSARRIQRHPPWAARAV